MLKKVALGISSLTMAAVVGLGMAPEASAGPAAPLTSLNVVKVESQLGGVETINPNSFSTTRDHGGSYLYVYTREIGYGQFPFAKMDGFDVKSVGSQIIGGNPIVGWEYKWDVSKFKEGTFEYQKTSINYPRNTLRTSIYIK
ncbi:YolA family protein [Bacillus sp. IBL03825]|uniref:YolA family protein n=1 Tax=Bacillus sp. IBL03825 TaxID=2953580 RepID=UPI002157D7C3|nr:YolA family protein [Bacillus sp. IBL03825]MCR6850505.1 YolA family protein [Bacillus sp. IBL03825]